MEPGIPALIAREALAPSVLLENINSLERAQEFAARINDKMAGAFANTNHDPSLYRCGTSWARRSWRTAPHGP